MAQQTYHGGDQHPDEYREDLNPDAEKYEYIESQGESAFDIKEIQRRYPDLTNDELRQLAVVPPGGRLEQGATYLDLRMAYPEEFTAMGGMEAGHGNWYVSKSETDYQLWNQLIGVQNPERLREADDGATDGE
jgi:hypothetical protein